MQITVTITLDDVIAGYMQLARSNPAKPRSVPGLGVLRMLFLLLAVTIPVAAGAVWGTFPSPFDTALPIALGASAVFMGYMVYAAVRELLRARKPADPIEATAAAMRRRFQIGEARPELGSHTITLTPEGYECITADSRVARTWRFVESIRDLPDYIALCRSASSGLAIPKRSFASPADAQAFLAEAQRLHSSARRDRQVESAAAGSAGITPPRRG